jgi:hypothetical protein
MLCSAIGDLGSENDIGGLEVPIPCGYRVAAAIQPSDICIADSFPMTSWRAEGIRVALKSY